MNFEQSYNRSDWYNFLEDKFLPEDFRRTEKSIEYTGNYSKKVTNLGECPSLRLNVFEINHSSMNDARVGLSKEAFSLIRDHTKYNKALVLFVPEGSYKTYRFSYVEYTPKVDEKGKVTREISNPRRYSYILGKDAKVKTPSQYLYVKETVKNEEDLKNRFSVEVLTKEFYNKLFNWYDKWAIEVVKFPNGTGKDVKLQKGEQNRIHLIRLITRFIFVWFIKQKRLIPDWIFDKNEISKVLSRFNSDSLTDGNYYNGIIQNLFFATLNKPIQEREFANKEEKKRVDDYGIKTVFRDTLKDSLFAISKETFIKNFETIPFLNGGLFECLDNFDTKEYIDGFSREKERQAFIPNALFWGRGEQTGLIDLFNTYNFTIEENTPQDIDVALDPELLGKAFENLLGTFNEETKSTARNESGSFYTPREIVDYMVDSSLKEYFKEKLGLNEKDIEEKLVDLFSYNNEDNPFNPAQTKTLMEAINHCKILDPACGSGAFPMGILNKLSFIMQKLDKNNEYWKQLQIEYAMEKSKKAYGLDNKENREKRLKEIQDIFEVSTGEYSNYARKLFLIENCIYGVDIQPIAIQISKLRFFISLIVDQKTDGTKENNYNVLPLPNLETKFVAANTLIGIKKEQGVFANPEIENKQTELLDIRHKHFSARDAKEKIKLRKKDKVLCKELVKLLKEDGFCNSTDAEMLANWDPYNPSVSSGFFDPYWMFGLSNENTSLSSTSQNSGYFDIVIGNPPYGARYSEIDKKYFKKNYKTAITITNIQKGSLDTFTLFIEKGHYLCNILGNLHYIVPISITSSDSITAVHRLLESSCSLIKVSSYAVRPQPIFINAMVNTSILFFKKDDKLNEMIMSTKMYRKNDNLNIHHLINNLQFINVKDVKLIGRYPKISLEIEKNILIKIFSQQIKIKDIIKKDGSPIYYRTSGGRYYKVITNYSTGSTKEKFIYFNKKLTNSIGAILSSNLYFWFYQIFSNNLDLKKYEIEAFCIPNLYNSTIKLLDKLYLEYLIDIEKNSNIRQAECYANIESFKEYKIGKSKHLIDKIDNIICPLYGLTNEEINFIKNYEIDYRLPD